MTMQLTRVDPETGQHTLTDEVANALRKLAESDQKDAAPKTADMAQRGGLLGGLSDLEILGIPVGEALGGGTVALLTSEALDGVLAGQDTVMRAVVKLAAGAVMVQALGGIVGPGLSRSAAMFLAFDASRDLLPIDSLVQQLVGGLTGIAGRGRMGQAVPPGAAHDTASVLGSLNGTVPDQATLDAIARSIQ